MRFVAKFVPKKAAIYSLKFGITIILFYVILYPLDVDRIWTILGGIDPYLAAIFISLLGIQTIIATARWNRVLQPLHAPLSLAATFRILLIGAYFNQGLPSAIGGDAVRVLYVQRTGLSLSKAMSSVILDRLAAMLWLLVMTAVSFPALLEITGGSREAWAIGIIALLGILALVVFGGSHLLFERWRHNRLLRGLNSISIDFWRVLFRSQTSFDLHLLSILNLSLAVLVVYTIALGLGVDISFLQCLVLMPPVFLLIILPISIAGWGLREGIIVSAFAFVGVPGEEAVAVSVLFGLGVLLWGLPGGVLWLTQRSQVKPASTATVPGR
jgi:hypothetical protein